MIQLDQFRFGISPASLIPWSIRSWFWPWGSPLRVAQWAADAGYDFFQGLPLRGVTGWEKWPLPTGVKEPAWNPVNSLGQVMRHENGDAHMTSKLRDWLAFPSPATCWEVFDRLPGRAIYHGFGDGKEPLLVEINPELEMSSGQIADICRDKGHRLAFDFEHFSRPHREGKPCPFHNNPDLTERDKVKMLAPYIDVVHVKWLTPREKETIRLLVDSPDRQQQLDFVAEYKPTLSPPWRVKQKMRKFLNGMKELVWPY